ncbi:MAG: DUF3750 domain-containing protein [Granulosicoccus sp.]|nr:DUF3750 domain-containing protein [Granulosicoccus sp.]
MKQEIHWSVRLVAIVFGLFFLPVGCMVATHYGTDGGSYSRFSRNHSTMQAPDADSEEAVIQVYAARAARWRGAFGVHSWISTKRTNERQYTRLEVIGYRAYYGGNAVRVRGGNPDGMWFGNRPTLLREIRGGERVNKLIDTLLAAAESYPYDTTYQVWPGPNSNTFIAYLARKVPQLRLEMPATAIGKDYLPHGALVGATPSGTGLQLSVRGYAGILAGIEEGLEINLFGLSAGIDLLPPAIKLPGIGRLGFSDTKKIVISEN